MRLNVVFTIIISLLFSSCGRKINEEKQDYINIILFDKASSLVELVNKEIYSDSSFNYKIGGYGDPNVYVVLMHNSSDKIIELNLSEIKKTRLVDSDTLDFNDWFNMNNENINYLVFKEDFVKTEKEVNYKNKISLYEIYILARSVE
jgi:hypothetical protein